MYVLTEKKKIDQDFWTAEYVFANIFFKQN